MRDACERRRQALLRHCWRRSQSCHRRATPQRQDRVHLRRHEEYGVFDAVAEAYLTGNPLVVCGTAGLGLVHLFSGLMDARKKGAAIIAIAGDVETSVMDTAALEERNPYKFFETASLYTGRVVNRRK